jgi:hypothetical protein
MIPEPLTRARLPPACGHAEPGCSGVRHTNPGWSRSGSASAGERLVGLMLTGDSRSALDAWVSDR